MIIRIKKADILLSLAGLLFLQLSVDLPGVDIPDLKDVPDFINYLTH